MKNIRITTSNRIKSYTKLIRLLFNNRENTFSIEHINFNALLFSATLFSIISCVFNFIGGFGLILSIFTIFSSLILGFIYYLSRFRNYYNTWISALSVLLILSVAWFMNGGMIGSVSYIYLLALLILTIIGKRHQQNRIFFLFFLNLCFLYILEYYFGEWLVHPYPTTFSYYNDIIFVFNLVLGCIFFVARFIRRSYDNEKSIVSHQKEVIEEQNRQHLASLAYASNLQNKILSNENQLKLLFNDFFVLFKPRDIVSGDFYWIKESGKYGIVAVADCTGHGVPAALLSILGISLFDEVVQKEGEELSAGMLLEKVRERFISYMKKSKSGSDHFRDGMDVGLFVVNYLDSTVQFSGANRPLILIRHNSHPKPSGYDEKETEGMHTLYSYNPIKNTIGFNYKEYSFFNHTIEFYPKDTFYLFSDGYVDQFDFKNKKKFSTRQFRGELLKLQELPMAAQKEFLDALHKSWKGTIEQTDDVLIIGLKM